MNDDDTTPAAFINARELAAILYRRRYWLILPTIAGIVAALVATAIIAPQYRSSATLLITAQQIPTTVVPTTLSNRADERIARIRQQIMSREQLTAMMRTLNLYEAERANLTLEEVLAIMRDAIAVDLVGAPGADNGSSSGNTIAFGLSFTYRDAAIAQAVTQRLTASFLDEDKRLRTEQAVGTAAFLGRRAEELREQLLEIAARRREIEARYAGALPEQVALSSQSGAALRAEISRTDAETQGLMQQNSLLVARGEEIAATAATGTEELRRAEERLNQLNAVYSDRFPDVVAAREAVDRQRATLLRDVRPDGGAGAIAAEVAAGRSRVATLAARRAELVGSVARMERMTALAPQATYELNNLEREYENLRIQYQGIREKQMEAQVAANLQVEGRGERFSVVDAPSLALEPTGMGPIKMMAMGVAGGLAMGLALVIGWEVSMAPIHGEGGVRRHTGMLPLVQVPMQPRRRGAGWLTRMRGLMRLKPGTHSEWRPT